jgi:hypothetical protein
MRRMARGIVTVGEFPNAMLAELARGRLQQEGIPAEVSGAMAQSWAGGDVPLFGVRVEVRREDAARARAILDELEGPAAVGAVFADDPGPEDLAESEPSGPAAASREPRRGEEEGRTPSPGTTPRPPRASAARGAR